MGLPTVFVRLTGCPLRCGYCDSEYAFFGGERKTIAELLEQVEAYKPRYVCVTGGEPLAQPGALELLTALADQGYNVSLETSGAMDVSQVDERISIVMDLKTPGSNEVQKNLYDNIGVLRPKDQIKFVLCGRQDYEWAAFKVREYQLDLKVGAVLFSPSHGELDGKALAEWILADNLPVRMQLQLHKLLWGDIPGV